MFSLANLNQVEKTEPNKYTEVSYHQVPYQDFLTYDNNLTTKEIWWNIDILYIVQLITL